MPSNLTSLGFTRDSVSGALLVEEISGNPVLYAAISAAALGDNAVVAAAGAGLKIKVVSYKLVCTAANTVKWRSAAVDLEGGCAYAANQGVAFASDQKSPLLQTADNAPLNLNLSAATQVSGHVAYFVEA